MRVGLFDSGIGGLTVARAVKQLLPHVTILYLGDTARTPYGTKSPETISRYARECSEFLVQQGIDALVVACNTASSIALRELQEFLPVPVLGVIDGACRRAAELSAGGEVAVLGTEATIRSNTYERLLHEMRPQLKVRSISCPLFVPIVEEGLQSGEVVDSVIAYHLKVLKGTGIDTLILACTHYPLLAPAIQAYLGAHVALVECGQTTAEDLARVLKASLSSREEPSKSHDRFFVTDGLMRFQQVARRFFPEISQQTELIPSF